MDPGLVIFRCRKFDRTGVHLEWNPISCSYKWCERLGVPSNNGAPFEGSLWFRSTAGQLLVYGPTKDFLVELVEKKKSAEPLPPTVNLC